MSQETREGEAAVAQKFGVCVMVPRDAMASSKVDELARRKKQARGDLAVKVFEAIPNDYATMLSVRETMEPNNEVRAVEVRITADVTPLPEALETAYRLCQENAALRSQLAAAETRLAAAEMLLEFANGFTITAHVENKVMPVLAATIGRYDGAWFARQYLGGSEYATALKSPLDAYLMMIAANWLPQPEQQGGG